MNLKEARENSGMSPAELAVAARVSVSFLYKAEEGKDAVSRTLVARICKVLQVEIQQIEGLHLR